MSVLPPTVGPFRAPAWLPGGNLETLYAALLAPTPTVAWRRERWETPDQDFIDLDWGSEVAGAPVYVLFHGLEGSSGSHYARALMAAVRDRGRTGVVVRFRGCSGEPNRLPRAYHSGDSAEGDWILRRLRQRFPSERLFAIGVSLGGNMLLRWLGEQGPAAAAVVDRASAVSAPMDLTVSGHHLGRRFNRVYTANFLRTLKRTARDKLARFPGIFDGAAVERARNLYAFDDLVTAPLHRFRDADDYWRRASSRPVLRTIAVPTLLLDARNDPFVPAAILPTAADVSPTVTVEVPETGGHVGFVSGPFPGNLDWLPERLLSHFEPGT